jgi:protein-disulfide isomerase
MESAASLTVLSAPGGFWFFHDLFFREQQRIVPSSIYNLAAEGARAIPIEEGAMFGCVDQGRADGVINRDVALAKQLSVAVTPTIFVNGFRYNGVQDSKTLARIIRESAKLRSQSGDLPLQ